MISNYKGNALIMLIILLSAFAFFVMLVGCEPADEVEEEETVVDEEIDTIELTVASMLSSSHIWWDGMWYDMFEKIEDDTDGAVNFEIFTGGELVPVYEELEALDRGLIDIAAPILTIYLPQAFPLSEVTFLPLLDSDSRRVTRAFERLMESDVPLQDGKTFYEIEFADKGLKAWPAAGLGPYIISTTGERFNSPEDFMGKILRTSSRTHESFIRLVGAEASTIAAMELYDAFSRGTVDGTTYSIPDWESYGFQDQLDYHITGIDLGYYTTIYTMTKDQWNSLPVEVHQSWEDAHEAFLPQSVEEVLIREERMIEYNKERGGVFEPLEDLDQEVQDVIMKALEDTWYEWIDMLNDEGHPGLEVALLWRDLVVEEGCEVPPAIMELEEVYSN